MPFKFKSKYRNQKTVCLSKHNHDSKLEANYCNRLLAMKQAGEIYDFMEQENYPLCVNGIKICNHIVDFVVFIQPNKNNKTKIISEVHEIKSKITKTASWSIKHKLFKALYPYIKYEVIEKNYVPR